MSEVGKVRETGLSVPLIYPIRLRQGYGGWAPFFSRKREKTLFLSSRHAWLFGRAYCRLSRRSAAKRFLGDFGDAADRA